MKYGLLEFIFTLIIWPHPPLNFPGPPESFISSFFIKNIGDRPSTISTGTDCERAGNAVVERPSL